MSAEWEAEIRIRRNGRLVKKETRQSDAPNIALALVMGVVATWLDSHPDSRWILDDDDLPEDGDN